MADDDTLPGHLPALMLLKARADRETLLKDTLGSEYVTWRDLLPKGYRLWQPVPGNTVFRGMTIAAELVDRILTADTIVGAGDLQDAMLLGGKKEEWALPENVADALDDPSSGWSGADNPLSKAMSYWKVWSLFAPGRILRVEVNNTTGDADATFNFPGIFKYTPEAAADLYRDLIKGENQVAREGLREWMELGVIDSGMTVGELRDVLTLPMLSNLAEPNPLAFMRWLAMPANVAKGYFQKAAQFNAYREGILRLAAARYFENAMNAAPAQRIYAASNPAIIDAILNDATQSDVLNRRVAAARLSRDLLGDYNNLSAGGTFVRSRLIPFYSWMELNAKRYFWLFKNLQANSTAQGRGAGSQTARLAAAMGVRTGVSTALGVTSGVVAVHAFYVLATAWNALVMGDEDDELQKSGAAVGRGLHIILGRNKDGTVQTLRLEGAWADMLEWFGAEDFPKDIRDLTSGTKKWGDWLEETAIAPVNRVVNGANPFGKDFIEYLFKRSTYPDVRNPRAVRDRNLALAEKYQVGALYRYVLGVTGQPVPPVKPKGLLEQVLTYNVDPGEAAYYAARKLAYDYMKASKGGDDRIIIPGERDNALYYSRRAAQWGDEEAAHKWYERYRQLGGTPQGARTSIERSAPIAVIPDLKLRAFLSSLSPDQRETIEIARRWHRTAVSAPALAARSRPTLPAPVR